jgi:hypothetical protein
MLAAEGSMGQNVGLRWSKCAMMSRGPDSGLTFERHGTAAVRRRSRAFVSQSLAGKNRNLRQYWPDGGKVSHAPRNTWRL